MNKKSNVVEKVNMYIQDQQDKSKETIEKQFQQKFKRIEDQKKKIKDNLKMDAETYELDKQDEYTHKKKDI
jgi:hypothetical protein